MEFSFIHCEYGLSVQSLNIDFFAYVCEFLIRNCFKQECIPVGCVPPTH